MVKCLGSYHGNECAYKNKIWAFKLHSLCAAIVLARNTFGQLHAREIIIQRLEHMPLCDNCQLLCMQFKHKTINIIDCNNLIKLSWSR